MPRYKDSPEERAAKQERREKLRELLALMEAEDVRDLKSVFGEMLSEAFTIVDEKTKAQGILSILNRPRKGVEDI